MALRIIRNDITKMACDAIVNTANANPVVGPGCDRAVYQAAGYEELLRYRREHIGSVKEGEAFLTPGFHLKAGHIIHAVSPLFRGGRWGEERKLRSCYQNSLKIALENGFGSIAFPLIATGGFGYPKEEGLRIAVDEINRFLLRQDMLVYLVVFDEHATDLGRKIYPGLKQYIDRNYVKEAEDEFGDYEWEEDEFEEEDFDEGFTVFARKRSSRTESNYPPAYSESSLPYSAPASSRPSFRMEEPEVLQKKLGERMKHLSDTFSEYLLYLIRQKGMTNAEVYKRAIVDKKTFSKIKNNKQAHPQKITAMCLCVGAKLNMDETRDLLARAGYALSPCDRTDIIFSYFIENGIYDMIELDIQLEEYGLPCLIE